MSASTPTDRVALHWDGQRVHIEYQWQRSADTGAPLLVFLHEGLGSVAMWRDFPATLCATLGCRGLVYSRPGYGRSTPRPPDVHWGPDFMHRQAAELLPALLQALGVDPVRERMSLLGHSDGGSIALLFASMFPAQLRACIVLAPHIVVEELSLHSIAQTRQAYLHTDLRQKLARYHDDPDSAFWGWNDIWLHPDFRTWRIDQALASIRCPVLAIQGLGDSYGTLEQVRGIARVVPQCQVVELPDCGHAAHKDQSQRVTTLIRDFLQRQTWTNRIPPHLVGLQDFRHTGFQLP